ncbi:MAG: carboxypeptidase-like regulatory domain-containing protein, partial [Bacteroidia bacterium]
MGVLRWYLVFVFVILLCNISISQDNPKRNWKLEINGTVTAKQGGKLGDAKITIFMDGSEVKTIYTTSNGKFNQVLDPDHEYTFKVSKPSYVSKIFEVSTNNGPIDAIPVLFATPEVELFKEIKDLDVSILEKPVGKIFFDATQNTFGYDAKYSKSVRQLLEKMTKELEEKLIAEEEAKKKAAEEEKKRLA